MCAAIDDVPESDERQRIRLLLQVARAYYEDEKDQAEIATEFGYSRSTISRMLTEARRRKVVRFQIGHPLEQAFAVEERLRRRFGMAHTWVATLDQDQPVAQAVGTLAADVIQRFGGQHTMLALSNGNSVAEVVRAMPQQTWNSSAVIQMIGSLGGVEHDLIDSPTLSRTMARKLGGTYRALPVPIVLQSPTLARSIMREEMVLTTLELAARSDIALVGVGTVGTKGTSGEILQPFITRRDQEEIRRSRAVAHISGHHFDARGKHVHVSLCDRTIAMDPERLSDIKLPILAAWGTNKVPAIHAVLTAELGLNLVCDERTAQLLLDYNP